MSDKTEKKGPPLRYVLATIAGLAILVSNVGTLMKPGLEIGQSMSRLQSVEAAEVSTRAMLAEHAAKDEEREIAHARELGEISQALKQINSNVSEIKSTQGVMWKAIRKEIT